MPRALLWLLWKKVHAQVRRATRVQGNPKRLVMLVVGILALVLWLGPSLVLAVVSKREPSPLFGEIGPLAIALFACFSLLVSSGEGAIAFQPAEVDLLFPGPFTRRQLLGYKILGSMIGSLPGAVIFSILFLRHASAWWTAFVGFVLALWFIQLLGTAAALLKQIVGEMAYTRARRLALGILLVGAAAGVAWVTQTQTLDDPREVLRRINESTAGRVLLAPFRVYVRVLTSAAPLEAGKWIAWGMGINAVLAGLVLRLDADYLEASVRASERMAERVRRARSGNLFAPATGGGPVRSRSLRLPRALGGAAPICWRHWTTLTRGGRKWMFQILAMIVFAGVMTFGLRRANTPDTVAHWAGIGALAYVTIILAAVLRFDFRGDLDHLETLKALPISPRRIALGEMLVPVAILLAVQGVVVGAMAALFAWPAGIVVAALVGAPVVNLLVIGVENTLFLLYPARLANRGVADFSLMGRQMLLFLGKAIIYGLCGAAIGLLAFGTAAATGSHAAAVAVGWCATAACAGVSILAAARAFDRFDVSSDMPS
jgi:hypothetical protein